MDARTRLELFGTEEELPAARRLSAGLLEVVISGGAVRGVFWSGVEVLRGIDYPIRDVDWGTYPQRTLEERFEEGEDRFAYSRRFTVAGGRLSGRFTLEGSGDGQLAARFSLSATESVTVNRAGFVVLHPIAGVAGSPLGVVHSDGTMEETCFPELISPGQPVFDIARLTQSANGVAAEIAFSGEVFEMEDQRNWSDASYKTYCRPLTLPYPYALNTDEEVEQEITVTCSGEGTFAGTGSTEIRFGPQRGRVPEAALALEPGWEAAGAALDSLEAGATRLRIDLTDPDWPGHLVRIAPATRGACDVEAVTPDDTVAIDAVLSALAGRLEALGVAPRRVAALPKAYLKSYQPDGEWPAGATPEDAIAAARRHFPQVPNTGGMLTNFTELNRYRGGAEAGDAVTHGTTAIVHAADDLSVMQTLEALPQIFASAAAIAPRKPYHLGLVSIGMRSNPYGAGLAKNPENIRRPMADADPRQRGLFAAAFMVGALAATEGSEVESIALGAPAGPMGLIDEDGARPVFHAFRALARLSGKPRLAVERPSTVAAVAAVEGDMVALVLANLAPEPCEIALPGLGDYTILEPRAQAHDWLDKVPHKAGRAIALGAYAVAFARLVRTDGGERTP